VDGAASLGGTFPHADQPVPATGPRGAAAVGRVRDGEVDRDVGVAEGDASAARPVAGGIGQCLLHDAERGLVGSGAQRAGRAGNLDGDR